MTSPLEVAFTRAESKLQADGYECQRLPTDVECGEIVATRADATMHVIVVPLFMSDRPTLAAYAAMNARLAALAGIPHATLQVVIDERGRAGADIWYYHDGDSDGPANP